MRTIREMLGNDEKVWVYIDGRETWEKFAGAAKSEGFRFGEISPEKWVPSYVIAVHSSREMGHFPLFIWVRSFMADFSNTPKRIDFMKYCRNDKDFLCKTPHFTARFKQRL